MKRMNIGAGAGECIRCGRYFTVTGGGLNAAGLCRPCEEALPSEDVDLSDAESVRAEAEAQGAGLGV